MEKVIKIIAFILITGFLLNPSVFVLGEQSSEQPDPANENALVINQEIKDINTDIDDKKNDIKKMQEKQEKYSDAIGQKQSEKASLNNQLAILDNRLAKAELDIDLVETDIERIILEKQKTDIEIKTKNKEIANEIGDISNILNLLHKKNSVNSLEIMLLNSSLSDFLIEIRYLEDINKTIGDKLGELKKLKKSQENEREILDSKIKS